MKEVPKDSSTQVLKRNHPRRHSVLGLWVFGYLGLSLLGCSGPDGPSRYDVSGTVTHAGTPIPAGKIYFEPDTSAGNSGPAGFADIRDGQYDTGQSGKGCVGGQQRIRIEGGDGEPSPENEFHPFGNRYFHAYRTTFDVPLEDVEHDFEVPAE